MPFFNSRRRKTMHAAWTAALLLTVYGAASAKLRAAAPAIEVGTPTSIEVFPASFKLDSLRRDLRPIVTGQYADGTLRDLTVAAEVSVADAAIATLRAGAGAPTVVPVSNGQTVVRVQVGGQQATIPIEVALPATPDLVSFQYGALAVLTKQGCNSGACHGSPSGTGGFRLSLRAYDPALDAETLIREAFGRRVNLLEPQQSLLLRKPLLEVGPRR